MTRNSTEKPLSDQYVPVNKILIPLGAPLDKSKLIVALHALSAFKDPLLILFHVIEFTSRTAPLDPDLYAPDIIAAEQTYLTPVAQWLGAQGYHVKTKVAIARSLVEGIIEEANNGGYAAALLLKRRQKKGVFKRHKSVSERVSRRVECLVVTQLIEPQFGP